MQCIKRCLQTAIVDIKKGLYCGALSGSQRFVCQNWEDNSNPSASYHKGDVSYPLQARLF